LVKGCGVWLVDTTHLPQGLTPNDAFLNFGFRVENDGARIFVFASYNQWFQWFSVPSVVCQKRVVIITDTVLSTRPRRGEVVEN
jgi:hypothetical protein